MLAARGSEPIATSAPAAASACAQARPMPVAPPVTHATRPERKRSAPVAALRSCCISVVMVMSAVAGDDKSLGKSGSERAQVIAYGNEACPLPARKGED